MCLFCEIVERNIPSKRVYEDDDIMAFYDINPKADTHILLIPKIHIPTFLDVQTKEQQRVFHHLIQTLPSILKDLYIKDFKLICNSGKQSGQEVMHLHFHILSGNIQLS